MLGMMTSQKVICRQGNGIVGDMVLFKRDAAYSVGELRMCVQLGGGEQKCIISCCQMTPADTAAEESCIRRFTSKGTDCMISADSLICPLYYIMHASDAFHVLIPINYAPLMKV